MAEAEATLAIPVSPDAEIQNDLLANSNEEDEPSVCDPPCPVHECFCLQTCNFWRCQCGQQEMWGVEKIEQSYGIRCYIEEVFALTSMNERGHFDEILGQTMEGNRHICLCGATVECEKMLFQAPGIIQIHITWQKQTGRKTRIFTKVIEPVIQLENIFRQRQENLCTKYILRGFIAYRKSHYVAVFHHIASNNWVIADDSKIIKVGKWMKVAKKLQKQRLYPMTLYYEQTSRFVAYSEENPQLLDDFFSSEY